MEVTREMFDKALEKNLIYISGNLNSTKERNIVLFTGLSGSGNSTLINYLCRKELTVNKNENIVLKNPRDVNATKIGNTSFSEKFLPKYLEYNKFLFCDFPGFSDTRGALVNSYNSDIIRSIIEYAQSTIVVIVISEDELVSGRSRLFKELILRLKAFFPKERLERISALVITKSSPGENIEILMSKLCKKTRTDIVTKWHSKGCLAKMERAHQSNINQADRNQILDAIFNVQTKYVNAVNISDSYANSSYNAFNCTSNPDNALREICKAEIQKIFDIHILKIFDPILIHSYSKQNLGKIDRIIFDANLITSLSITELQGKIDQLNRSIEQCQPDCSSVAKKATSKEMFDSALAKVKYQMSHQVDSIILQCNTEIKRKQRPEVDPALVVTVAAIGLTFLFKKLCGF